MLPNGEVMGRRQPGGYWRYYLTDRLGSVRAVVNRSGGVSETRDYYPFGLRMPGRIKTSGTPAPEGFTGHELDAETGLLYAGARYLMPAFGRWMTPDPILRGNPSSFVEDARWRLLGGSAYNYAFNNPANLVDPTGALPCPPCGFKGTLRWTFGWAESRFNKIAQKVATAGETTRKFASSVAGTVVKEGPEVLDAVTYAATWTAIGAGGAAVITGPTVDDALHGTVASLAAGTATVSNTAATLLSIIDAEFYGGSKLEADIRLNANMLGVAVGGAAGGVISGYLTRIMLRQVQRTGMKTVVRSATGAAASEASKRMLRKRTLEERSHY